MSSVSSPAGPEPTPDVARCPSPTHPVPAAGPGSEGDVGGQGAVVPAVQADAGLSTAEVGIAGVGVASGREADNSAAGGQLVVLTNSKVLLGGNG
jgi:hypothetical protein